MSEKQLHKAVFFDRDGVLNHDHGYINKIEDFNFIDGAKEAVKLCKENGYKVFVVTNQSGIARGLYKEENVQILHNYVQEELKSINTFIDDFLYCPHHPDGKVPEYSIVCDCRKPEAGMILSLAKKHAIDLGQSFIVGDHERDIEAGRRAGIEGYLFQDLNLLTFMQEVFKKREGKLC